MKIAYLGPGPVTFGYMAAEKFFQGLKPEFVPCHTHREVCEAVRLREDINYGVVAIENSSVGIVPETFTEVVKLCSEENVHIHGERAVPVTHYLLGQRNLDQVRKIVSHRSAILQCSSILSNHNYILPNIITEACESTGRAAEMASENPEIAAIASDLARRHYKLNLLIQHSIENYSNNQTRFWILGKGSPKNDSPPKTGDDKTSIFLRLNQDDPGSLWEALDCFLKIPKESRPPIHLIYPHPDENRNWKSSYLVELGGHIEDEALKGALDELAMRPTPPLILGSYPNKTIPTRRTPDANE